MLHTRWLQRYTTGTRRKHQKGGLSITRHALLGLAETSTKDTCDVESRYLSIRPIWGVPNHPRSLN